MHSQTCRFCGRKLGLLERWRHHHYCSLECKTSFEQENARLAVEWLSELNRTAKKPAPPPPPKAKDTAIEELPEPGIPGFVAQPEPMGNDLAIHPKGFPAAKPCLRSARRREDSLGSVDRVPSKVALAHEAKRMARALWVLLPQDSSKIAADAYQSESRYPICPAESSCAEDVFSLSTAGAAAVEITTEIADTASPRIGFTNDSFDWKFSCYRPTRQVLMTAPALKADCCDLPVTAVALEAWGIKEAAMIPDSPSEADVELPLLQVALAPIDFRPSIPGALDRTNVGGRGMESPVLYRNPASTHGLASHPTYSAPAYPLPYPVVTIPSHMPPAADTLIHALMSATAARPDSGVIGPGFDTSVVTSILPALLASGWIRIEPDFGHLIPLEPEMPREAPGVSVPPLDQARMAINPIWPRFHLGGGGALPSTEVAALPETVIDVEEAHRGFEGPAAASIAIVEPHHQFSIGAEFESSDLLGIGVPIFEPDREVLGIPSEPILDLLKPEHPTMAHTLGRPQWKARSPKVSITVRPLDLSFFDIPMEAGPWARE